MLALLYFLILLQENCSGSSTQIVVVYGYPPNTVQWLYIYPGVEANYCWETLYSNRSYDFAYYSLNRTCYLTAYQFVSPVLQGSSEDGRKIGFLVNGETCEVGENPPTYNNTIATTPYHNITFQASLGYWTITPKTPCSTGAWSIRGDQIVCYTIETFSASVTYTSAQAQLQGYSLSSPINPYTVKANTLSALTRRNTASTTAISAALVLTDGKRTDSCNTAAMINTTACQYPEGFEFVDTTNPMHSYYTWVDQPQISTSRQCVGSYITTDTTNVNNGKFDFFPCEACDNSYCYYFAFVIIT